MRAAIFTFLYIVCDNNVSMDIIYTENYGRKEGGGDCLLKVLKAFFPFYTHFLSFPLHIIRALSSKFWALGVVIIVSLNRRLSYFVNNIEQEKCINIITYY